MENSLSQDYADIILDIMLYLTCSMWFISLLSGRLWLVLAFSFVLLMVRSLDKVMRTRRGFLNRRIV